MFGWMGSVVEARSATRIAMEQMRDAWRAEVGGTFQEKEYAPRRTAGKNVFLGWHGPPGLGWIASGWELEAIRTRQDERLRRTRGVRDAARWWKVKKEAGPFYRWRRYRWTRRVLRDFARVFCSTYHILNTRRGTSVECYGVGVPLWWAPTVMRCLGHWWEVVRVAQGYSGGTEEGEEVTAGEYDEAVLSHLTEEIGRVVLGRVEGSGPSLALGPSI